MLESPQLRVLRDELLGAELSHQLEAAQQALSFLNNKEDFQVREVSILLRTLQLTRLEVTTFKDIYIYKDI